MTKYGLVENNYTDMSDYMVGKAGEYLVCADLIMKGFNAYPIEQALPYDVILHHRDKLLKIQVKTTRAAQQFHVNSNVPQYGFHLLKRGNKRMNSYEVNDLNIYAFVVLDTKEIGYYPFSDRVGKIYFRSEKYRGSYWDERVDLIRNKINNLKDGGDSRKMIAEALNVPIHKVDRLLYGNGKNKIRPIPKGVYLKELTLEKCMSILDGGYSQSKKDVLSLYKESKKVS